MAREEPDASLPFTTRESREGTPLAFFLLVSALSVPFYVAGAVARRQPLPGLPRLGALMVVCPAIAAAILRHREGGGAAARGLVPRAIDWRRVRAKGWYLPALLVMPATAAVAYGVMRATGLPLPATPHVPLLAAPALFLAFLVAGLCEELGWSGYAADAMLPRWGALRTGVLVGVAAAAWHVIPLVQVGRPAAWIAWWSLWSASARVITVRLYDGAGRSVFLAALFHATVNVSWQLFPNRGSHWDPRVNALAVAFAAAIVTLVGGPRRSERRLGVAG